MDRFFNRSQSSIPFFLYGYEEFRVKMGLTFVQNTTGTSFDASKMLGILWL